MQEKQQAIDMGEPRAVVAANVKKRQSDTPKPSMTVKRAWHSACFQPREKRGAGRHWKRASGWMPLKVFAVKMQEAIGQQWLANK